MAITVLNVPPAKSVKCVDNQLEIAEASICELKLNSKRLSQSAKCVLMTFVNFSELLAALPILFPSIKIAPAIGINMETNEKIIKVIAAKFGLHPLFTSFDINFLSKT